MKSSTKEALERYYEKLDAQIKKDQRPKKRNRQPEKEVQDECVAWANAQGWAVNIFSAKATYDPKRGIYRSQSMKAGVCDCQGADANGHAVFVEFKSPGRLSTFNLPKNYRQKEYIRTKINSNAFACVVDGVERLALLYAGWQNALNISKEAARLFLLKNLP